MHGFLFARPLSVLGACASVFLISACSGGGGTTPPPPPPPTGGPPPPPTSQGPTFTPNVFAPSSDFIALCENPRSGVDIEGNTFPDQQGLAVEERFWLRSWTEETYLFNDEVVDMNPYDFNDRIAYFNVLRTTAVTPSGEDKDDFHFSQSTEDFLENRNSAPTAGYGIRFIANSTTVPRDFRVAFTEPNSPASQTQMGVPNFQRGDRIIAIDGVDFINGANTDALNAGLFPQSAGEVHTFELEDVNGVRRIVDVMAANIVRQPVNQIDVINTPTGDVGYLHLTTFSPFSTEEQLQNAISSLDAQGVTDLVLDLRYNGGGLLAVASQLGFMIAGDARTNGRTFELLQFNADAGNRNPITGAINQPTPFFDTGLGFSLANGTPLSTLNLGRVYILSTEDTCSASESIINSLRGINVEVVLIGTQTCGKPFGFFPTDNCGVTYFTIQFQGVNDQGFGDYADGFIANNSVGSFGVRIPGCAVDDDLSRPLGDPAEALLAAALNFRENGTCPPASTSPKTTVSKPIGRVATKLGSQEEALIPASGDVFETNRDLTMPGDRDNGR